MDAPLTDPASLLERSISEGLIGTRESPLRAYLRQEVVRRQSAEPGSRTKARSRRTGTSSDPSLPDPNDDSFPAMIARVRADFRRKQKIEEAWETQKKQNMRRAKKEGAGLYTKEYGFLLTPYERQLRDLEFEHGVRARSYGKAAERGFGI
jgi:hypothetical protein